METLALKPNPHLTLETFDTLDSCEKTIAILGDRWWSQTANREGDKTCKHVFV